MRDQKWSWPSSLPEVPEQQALTTRKEVNMTTTLSWQEKIAELVSRGYSSRQARRVLYVRRRKELKARQQEGTRK